MYVYAEKGDNCEKDKICAYHLLDQYLKYLQYFSTWTRKMPIAILFNQQCLRVFLAVSLWNTLAMRKH